MTEPPRCPTCNTELPPDTPPCLCPGCLLQAGLESQRAASGEPAPTAASPSVGFVPPAVELLASHFPQLEILTLLGKGGMGAVYKARQRGLDRLVAVKVLPPEVGHDPAFAERFMREARALARLSHPNIVAVFDFGQQSGLYYFVMEYVDGVNLRQAMNQQAVLSNQALTIVGQVCDALQYAHDEGIVHRDIKPENILLDKKGRVKIADFGLSNLLGQEQQEVALTGTHQVMGTLRYMAPEQMEGLKQVDHRADIYSLGVVFYELLTGEVPLGRFEPPSHIVEIDVRLDEVVLRSLAREPAKRYQKASQVKTEMEAASHDARSAVLAPPTVSDGLVFQRLSVFNSFLWLIWSGLLAALQWGYLSEAKWYFQKELPYDYLTGAWSLVSLMFAFFSGYWWYLLVKSPDTPRSLPDAWRTLQTPDRRAIGLWVPGVGYLAVWIAATVLTMSFADDAVQSTTHIALLIAAPLVAAGSSLWVYRPRLDVLRSLAAARQEAGAFSQSRSQAQAFAAHSQAGIGAGNQPPWLLQRVPITIAAVACGIVACAWPIQYVERGFWGVDRASVSGVDGVTISSIEPGSPAAAAGFKDGDQLMAINGQKVGFYDVSWIWKRLAVGSEVELRVERKLPGPEVWPPPKETLNLKTIRAPDPIGGRMYMQWQLIYGIAFFAGGAVVIATQPLGAALLWRGTLLALGFSVLLICLFLTQWSLWTLVWQLKSLTDDADAYQYTWQKWATSVAALTMIGVGLVEIRMAFQRRHI